MTTWLEYDADGECWRIEVRDDGVFAVAFTRPITVEWRIGDLTKQTL